MTDRHPDLDLHDLLSRATDALEAPPLAPMALATARRRVRRRGAAAVAATGVAVALLVVGTHVVGRSSVAPADRRPAPTEPTPTITAAPTPGTAVTYRRWDPRRVDELPAAAATVASVLPERIEFPATAPSLTEAPLDAAVLAAERDGQLRVLGTDGGWRQVAEISPTTFFDLSPDGTRLVAYDTAYGSPQEATVHDLPTAASWVIPLPDDYTPWDHTSWRFATRDTLLVTSDRAWWVEASTGDSRPIEIEGSGRSVAFDPDGALLRSADFDEPNLLADYTVDPPRQVSMERTGRLATLQADAETVVGVTYDGRPFSVVVADRATLTPRYIQPLGDHDAYFSNGALSVIALREDGTVLLRITKYGNGSEGFRVASWAPATGALSVVATVPSRLAVDFAETVIGAASG